MTAGDSATGDSPKAQYGKIDGPRLSAEEMDERRKANVAYEYLCHLEEAKIWIEACTGDSLPPTTELEEGLRNGVYLAKLGHFMSPEKVPLKKIYDRDQARYQARGLHFRHTDNINHWLKALQDVDFPKIFYPETTDIYDRKNIPRLIYCIHALSLYLFKLGKAPQIQDLYGKVKFTDEEISAMRRELDKYGIQMPAFSKIGGILANEMPVDEAALHAAVIAINEALERQVAEETLTAMSNPESHLNNIYPELAETYQDVLYEAKETKAEIARNKSLDPDSSYIPDVYDELLTQAEIQGNLNKVNMLFALGNLHDALAKGDRDAILEVLQAPQLKMSNVQPENVEFYTGRLLEAVSRKSDNNNEEDRLLNREEVQMAVKAGNIDADSDHQKVLVVRMINEAIDNKAETALVEALQNPTAELPKVHSRAAGLYLQEFGCIKAEKRALLEYDEIVGSLEVLTAVANINEAVDSGNDGLTFCSLRQESAHIAYLDEDCKAKYQEALESARAAKPKSGCPFLTHFEIQQCIDGVNQQTASENDRIEAVHRINEAIDQGIAMETYEALVCPTAHITDVEGMQALQYQNLLQKRKQQKAKETSDASAVLWYEEIQETVAAANGQADDGSKLSLGVMAANIAVDGDDARNLMTCLQNADVGLHSVTAQCAATYLRKLRHFKEKKAQSGESGGGWMMNRLREGHKFFFNVHTMEYSWKRPGGVKKDHGLLTKEEIQSCIAEVTASHDRQLLFKANERFIVQIQARVRGYLCRQQFQDRMNYMQTHLPAVLMIQSWWRMVVQRRSYQHRLKGYRENEDAIIALQAAVRMHLVRSKYQRRLEYFRRHEASVIKIQSFLRANWAKQDYRVLMHGSNPPLSVVRKFVHLLDICDLDYSEEIDVQKLREQVVTEIRSNQALENDLNDMDIKIGLLVKNRITLQDVISQHKTLKEYREHNTADSLSKGLKALSKVSRERLEAYQHLFYLLQTNPVYLAKLIFEMPQSRTTRFMESVILTIYNYASNQREEFLLLRLFKTALEEEIRSKVEAMSDIVTGNPMVVKMIVSYNRNARGQGVLRELLNPLVKQVIEDRALQINTNPTEVYKQWVNQMETQSGKPSGLPYDVTQEQALQHEEVQSRIQDSIRSLSRATDKFLAAILSSVNMIPYGMRYMARVMREALHSKFPEASEKDILKIVGNLIYYRYINSAIVAPDAFDIIDVGANRGLTNDQRRNLGSIAKILQFAASNKGFGGDSAHLACLNSYIMDAHGKFKKYFRAVCDVDEPEVKFNMDQYTDVTRVTKPVIYISIAEMVDTHKSLLEHQDAVAPDHTDPLHELLDDLGEVPDTDALIGDAGLDENGSSRGQLAKTEISLTLSNKFEVPEDDRSDVRNILIRAKRMIVDVVRCQRSGNSLQQILQLPASDQEEGEHQLLIKKRERVDMKASRQAKLVRHQSMSGDTRLALEAMKVKICNHLQHLEKAGVTSLHDGYQSIINSIVQDIRNQRLYRQRRKQEMVRLRQTLHSLGTKRSFYEEQIDYYNQYVKTCLDNLSTKSRKGGRKALGLKESGKTKAKGTIKYSAARLYEKGIVLEIEGLPTNQFKNVLFEISATEQAGMFDLSAKFMGVNMEKVQLIFQDLLQLQYEGVAVMKMFDKAKVNVNLLVFLLNKKFYGK